MLKVLLETDPITGCLVASLPGIAGAHTQGASLEEVRANLTEVVELLSAQGVLDETGTIEALAAVDG